jgi:hypothetical protein
MKLIGKILIGLLLLGLLILVGYVAYVYLLPKWVPILFYTYLILGMADLSVGIIKVLQAINEPGNWGQALLKLMTKMAQASDVASRFKRLRDAISSLASTVARVIVWPVDSLYGLFMFPSRTGEQLNVEEFSLKKLGDMPEASYSLYALVVVLAVLGLGFLRVDLKKYGAITLALMVASASLRHLSYTVGTVSLPARLRRIGANPYAMFLVVAGADFSILVLGLTALNLPGKLDTITEPALIRTGHELLQSEGALWGIFKGARPSLHQLIVAFVGILFSLALLKVLKEFGEFKRKDEDYTWLAQVANRLGNFSASLRHLRNVKSWNLEARSAEIVALLGVNEIEKAAQKTWSMLESDHKDVSEATVFATMTNACLLPHMPQSAYLAILKRAVDTNVQDAMLQDGLVLVIQNNLQKEVIAFLSPVADRLPLTTARTYLLSGDFKTCLANLEGRSYSSDLDQLIGQVLIFTAYALKEETTQDQKVKSFASCATQAIPLVRKLNDAHIEPWERFICFEEVQRMLLFAHSFGPDRVEQLRFLADSIKDKLKDEDSVRRYTAIESHFSSYAA